MTRHYRGIQGVPDLVPAFRYAREMPASTHANPQGHTVLYDPEIFDRVGYATADECSVLWACASGLPGRWIEIGSHTGWTTAHLAISGNGVVALDPEFGHAGYNKTEDAAFFLARFEENLTACGVWKWVEAVPRKSEHHLPQYQGKLFDGAFVDGEHEPPFPENDARLLLPLMRDDAVVIFHDALGGPVQDGIRVIVEAGFKWRLYKTAQLLAVCWRGNFEPPPHAPDPSFAWDQWIADIMFDRELLVRQS